MGRRPRFHLRLIWSRPDAAAPEPPAAPDESLDASAHRRSDRYDMDLYWAGCPQGDPAVPPRKLTFVPILKSAYGRMGLEEPGAVAPRGFIPAGATRAALRIVRSEAVSGPRDPSAK